MLSLKSTYSPEQLTARWDERTSPARFAGNDDVLDNIYIASRKRNRVFLIRKARGALDPFATVFRGRIVSCGDGSELRGFFSKRLFDYLLLLCLLALDLFVYERALAQAAMTDGLKCGCLMFALVMLLLAVPLPFARRRYRDFLLEITGDYNEK